MGIMTILLLITGPVGDYLGLDYQFFIYAEGFDSLYTITGDSGDVSIFDTSTVIDTLTYQGHPAYKTLHVRISDLFGGYDTTLAWEVGDSLFSYMAIGETVMIKNYVIPFFVGSNWQFGIVGDTLIGDFDDDGIDDTLYVQIAEGLVTDSLNVTVPLGSFDAFEVQLTVYCTGWQSSVGDSCRLWLRPRQLITPYLGLIKDSILIEDTIRIYNNWVWAMTGIMYSEAVDTGYIGIAEAPQPSFQSVRPIRNGVEISGDGEYEMWIYDIIGRQCLMKTLTIQGSGQFRPELPAGIYFARIRHKGQLITTKFVIVK
ncbi:MAG TPA: T9SS type A sorting domain-containing protein [bacterium (Candidatus Stahlbacteria)]|nr:T9SS type A sorting domain-containing protein [Candidatus Stahlbacteria bacterium]